MSNMPIKIEEAKKYKGYEKTEIKIIKFLESHKGKELGYASDEIRKGIGRAEVVYAPDKIWENLGIFALDVATTVLFDMNLQRMVEEGKLYVIEYEDKKYYYLS